MSSQFHKSWALYCKSCEKIALYNRIYMYLYIYINIKYTQSGWSISKCSDWIRMGIFTNSFPHWLSTYILRCELPHPKMQSLHNQDVETFSIGDLKVNLHLPWLHPRRGMGNIACIPSRVDDVSSLKLKSPVWCQQNHQSHDHENLSACPPTVHPNQDIRPILRWFSIISVPL